MNDIDKIAELIKELKVGQLKELIEKLRELGILPEAVAITAKPKPPSGDNPHIPGVTIWPII